MSKHTPTPWKISMGYIEDANGNDIFHKSALFVGQRTVKEVMELSIHIVKCVNSHDELLEALKEALKLLEDHQPVWYLKRHYNIISQAIAKAEGK